MIYYLNIGTAVKGEQNALSVSEVLNTLVWANLEVISYEVKQSDTEETVVAVVRYNGDILGDMLWSVSCALHQDCIAVYCPKEQKGELNGPNAVEWGEFNSRYF